MTRKFQTCVFLASISSSASRCHVVLSLSGNAKLAIKKWKPVPVLFAKFAPLLFIFLLCQGIEMGMSCAEQWRYEHIKQKPSSARNKKQPWWGPWCTFKIYKLPNNIGLLFYRQISTNVRLHKFLWPMYCHRIEHHRLHVAPPFSVLSSTNRSIICPSFGFLKSNPLLLSLPPLIQVGQRRRKKWISLRH